LQRQTKIVLHALLTFKTIIHIDSTDDIEEVIIYDINGKNVFTSHQADMDLSGLSEGIYMVMVRSTSGRSFAKIIKQ